MISFRYINYNNRGDSTRFFWSLSCGFERNDGFAEYFNKNFYYRRKNMEYNPKMFVSSIPLKNNKTEQYKKDVI